MFKKIFFAIIFTTILVMNLFCTSGCDKGYDKQEALAYSLDCLTRDIEQANQRLLQEDDEEWKQWANDFLLPGLMIGQAVLQDVEVGKPCVITITHAHLGVRETPNGWRAGITLRMIHPLGHNQFKGLYFTTPDGKTYECDIMDGRIERSHYVWGCEFMVLFDDYEMNEEDHLWLKEAKSKPIRLPKEVIDSDGLEVGLILADGKHSNSVPASIKNHGKKDR